MKRFLAIATITGSILVGAVSPALAADPPPQAGPGLARAEANAADQAQSHIGVGGCQFYSCE